MVASAIVDKIRFRYDSRRETESMSEEPLGNLSKAPIVEALFDLQAPAGIPWDDERAKLLRAELVQRLPDYPVIEELRAWEQALRFEKNQPPETTLKGLGVRGLILHNPDKTQAVQFRRDGFGFSRLHPYQDWEQFTAEGLRLWQVFKEVCQPIGNQRLAIRYINRMQLTSLDLLGTPPTSPSDSGWKIQRFVHQTTSVGEFFTANVTFANEPLAALPWSVILDIELIANKSPVEDSDFDDLLPLMRIKKNAIFASSLTKEGLECFR